MAGDWTRVALMIRAFDVVAVYILYTGSSNSSELEDSQIGQNIVSLTQP